MCLTAPFSDIKRDKLLYVTVLVRDSHVTFRIEFDTKKNIKKIKDKTVQTFASEMKFLTNFYGKQENQLNSQKCNFCIFLLNTNGSENAKFCNNFLVRTAFEKDFFLFQV